MEALEQRMLRYETNEPEDGLPRFLKELNSKGLRVTAVVTQETYLHQFRLHALVERADSPQQTIQLVDFDERTDERLNKSIAEFNGQAQRVCAIDFGRYRGWAYKLLVLEAAVVLV